MIHIEGNFNKNESITNDDILQYALSNGIITIEDVQEKIAMKERAELLTKHPYKVWKGSDERYYTYLPCKENGRILKSRKTQKEIEGVIVDYWKEELKNPTIEDIYTEWIKDKLNREEITITTKNRYDRQYKESMVEFGRRRIKSIDEYDIERFVLETIHNHNMTSKGFSNLRTIIFGIFKLAKKKRMISFSISDVMSDIEISRKTFRRVKKEDDELIFMDHEMKKVFTYFKNKTLDIKDLGIILLFYTGMRPGELTALEWCDISENIINVHRTEVRYEDKNGKYVYKVRDFPKTEAGIRDIIIPQNALWIISELRNKNPNGKYVFEKSGSRMKTCVFDDRLRMICRKTGITEKSLNKIRKTYGTILIDANTDESLIISQMGHTDISTTKMYYYKNRKSVKQKAVIIDSVFDDSSLKII